MTPERWQQIKRVYGEAASLPPEQRRTLLDQVAAGDVTLRREVELMLEADQHESFLPAPVIDLGAPPTTSLVGRELSHYRVLAYIAAGGMGEVYRAFDTRLERQVALKVLPAQFTWDAERLQRFEREAKAASALNHPNIITIYEIGEVGETHFIATEFIEGVTLRARLAAGRAPLREALELTLQITAALEAAHQAGIIHRDIKPENVMVRPDGLVKVLDFGLAKLSEAPRGAGALESTARGIVIGTPRYMSPEQTRGQHVDKRTDIFSCGALLYELLSGQPAFAGETLADVYSAILTQAPAPLAACAPDVPDVLQGVVSKALAKSAEERYQQVGELRGELLTLKEELDATAHSLRSASAAPSQPPSVLAVTKAALARQPKWRVAVALIVLLLCGWALVKNVLSAWSGTAVDFRRDLLRQSEFLNENLTAGGGIRGMQFSPDGKFLAWALHDEGGSRLWVKEVGSDTKHEVTKPGFVDLTPVWSPTGSELAFSSNRSGKRGIWMVPWLGGLPKLLKELESSSFSLVAWGRKQPGIFFEAGSNLYTLDPADGQTTPLTSFASNRAYPRDFRLSPAEQQIAYIDEVEGKPRLLVKPLHGGTPRAITPGEEVASTPVWLPDGKRIAYLAWRAGVVQICLAWLDGREPVQVTLGNERYDKLAFSPTGNRLAAVVEKESANIYSYRPQSGEERRETSGFELQLFPQTSPVKPEFVFQATNDFNKAAETIYLKSDNAAQPLKLVANAFDAKWSPDGGRLAFLRLSGLSASLGVFDVGFGKETLLPALPWFGGVSTLPQMRLATNYAWSPDGAQIAYVSEQAGRQNLRITSADGKEDQSVSDNTDPALKYSSPFWSLDGKRLAFVTTQTAGERLRTVSVSEQSTIRQLFQRAGPLRIVGWSGKELLVASGAQGQDNRPLELTLWRVPATGLPAKELAQLPNAYLHNLSLSPDGSKLAFIRRQDGREQIGIISVSGRQAPRFSSGSDPSFFYSGLAWARDGETLYYSKQAVWITVNFFENFQ
jgi:serine/threonine protein kinase/Tol biopolymer transport system component